MDSTGGLNNRISFIAIHYSVYDTRLPDAIPVIDARTILSNLQLTSTNRKPVFIKKIRMDATMTHVALASEYLSEYRSPLGPWNMVFAGQNSVRLNPFSTKDTSDVSIF